MDTAVAVWLNQQAQHSGLRQLVVFGATFVVAVPVLIVGYLLVRSVHRRAARDLASLLVAGAGTVIALVANMIATSSWFRLRPYNALADVHGLVTRTQESSFFSDHTIAVTGLTVAALLVSRRWGLASAAAAVFVALCRVAVGAHYPTDVLTAAVVTLAAIAVLLPARPVLTRLVDRLLARLPAPHPDEHAARDTPPAPA